MLSHVRRTGVLGTHGVGGEKRSEGYRRGQKLTMKATSEATAITTNSSSGQTTLHPGSGTALPILATRSVRAARYRGMGTAMATTVPAASTRKVNGDRPNA
uniref:Uncharacterized protein n=1 Tax=Eutreptiella gymnastica TaxID=73025 RepID=A0A7S1IFN6_9EUGL